MNKAETFNAHRGLLFGIAYRMLGSVHDAEDILQDAFIRWQGTDIEFVENSKAFLTTVVTRLSIDLLRSARKRREEYVGEWLPEPLVENRREPADNLALAESLSTAFLLMLERLNPTERAAFLLREVFDYSYGEVADVIGKSETNCRQIVSRAKKRVTADTPRYAPPPEEQERLVASFMVAVDSGDMDALLGMLSEDAELHTDHGGKALAARRVLHGSERIAKFTVGLRRRFYSEGTTVSLVPMNGSTGVIMYVDGEAASAMTMTFQDGKVHTIYATRNPEKLTQLPAPQAS